MSFCFFLCSLIRRTMVYRMAGKLAGRWNSYMCREKGRKGKKQVRQERELKEKEKERKRMKIGSVSLW